VVLYLTLPSSVTTVSVTVVSVIMLVSGIGSARRVGAVPVDVEEVTATLGFSVALTVVPLVCSSAVCSFPFGLAHEIAYYGRLGRAKETQERCDHADESECSGSETSCDIWHLLDSLEDIKAT
jgi:hypothetical protein